MNLRTVRIQLTVVYGVLSLIAVGSLALIAIRTGTGQISDSAERAGEEQIAQALEFESPENTWQVHIGDQWDSPAGSTSVEPPLQRIASNALWHGETYYRFEQEGQWLAVTRGIEPDLALVAVVPFDEYASDVTSLRLRVALAALAAVAGSTAVGWFIAGRSLRPTRQVLAQQRDFIADAAHELRTPLAVIQASASLALSKDRSVPEYRDALVEIESATQRASAGVNELLEFARLEAGQALPRVAPLRLDLLVEEVVAGVRVEGVTVSAQVEEPVVASADYGLLRQAVDTVVRNAAERSTHVVVQASVRDRFGSVVVSDDGPGFPSELLDHVFDRFRRGDRKGSSGLGLAIARKIVETHGGTIAARNGEVGAVVTIDVPLAATIDR